MNRTLALVALTLISAHAMAADFIRHTQSDYAISEEMIQAMDKKGDSYYSVSLMPLADLQKVENSAFVTLDYMGLHKVEKHHYLVSKHVYMLNREPDFFSCKLLKDMKYMKALEKESVFRVGEMSYHLKGDKNVFFKYEFDLNWFADLNDCQNMQKDGTVAMNTAVQDLKSFDSNIKFDLHGTYLKDKPNFTQFLTAGWIFAKIHRVPTDSGDKTLVITYEISGMPSQYAMKGIVEKGHIQVMELEEKANRNYQPKEEKEEKSN